MRRLTFIGNNHKALISHSQCPSGILLEVCAGDNVRGHADLISGRRPIAINHDRTKRLAVLVSHPSWQRHARDVLAWGAFRGTGAALQAGLLLRAAEQGRYRPRPWRSARYRRTPRPLRDRRHGLCRSTVDRWGSRGMSSSSCRAGQSPAAFLRSSSILVCQPGPVAL